MQIYRSRLGISPWPGHVLHEQVHILAKKLKPMTLDRGRYGFSSVKVKRKEGKGKANMFNLSRLCRDRTGRKNSILPTYLP